MGKPAAVDRSTYEQAIAEFDLAICEAIAVSQASSWRQATMNVGYASYVFTRMCGAGVSFIRAAPKSRWVRADFDDWQLGAVAGHARSLLDGFLLFNYLIEPAKSEAEMGARINVMHLNDCTRRIELHTNQGLTQHLEGFGKQREELRQRLEQNEYFKSLPAGVQKNCLNGRFLMIDTRDEMLAKVGFQKGQFDALYDLWSQHVHVLPLSFYRMEPNGRGTGVENEADRGYIAQALRIGAALLTQATDKMVEQFPETASVRKGTKSKFRPGPSENLPPKPAPVQKSSPPAPVKESLLAAAMKKIYGR
ncbi:hypothetical protein [Paraburkholderia sp. MM5477-R1]|uniref:hypothetical protein n=1 Tax=Paraburkholderia sp. MM5477-R1 TaxID=2991062 RepID=UPI003D228789